MNENIYMYLYNYCNAVYYIIENIAQIDHITCKENKILSFIKRIDGEFKLSRSLKKLYYTLVKPIFDFEYGSV